MEIASRPLYIRYNYANNYKIKYFIAYPTNNKTVIRLNSLSDERRTS